MNYLDPQMLIGRTIVAVDNSACNLWSITFADGLKIVIEAVPQGYGLYGPAIYDAKDDGEECDECGAQIPTVDGGRLDNRHHRKSCSLYTLNND